MRIYMLSITSPHHRPLFSTSVTVAEDGSVNLFDMDSKYADVMPCADVLDYLNGLAAGRAAAE